MRVHDGSQASALMLPLFLALHQLAQEMATSKKVITLEEWEKKLRQIKMSRADLDKLIMNYLVTEGHILTAEKFQMESGIEPGIDLSTIADRVAIKKAIQCGDVEDAINKLNDLNPEILDTNPQLCFQLQQQRLIEIIRNGKLENALEFVQQELGPLGEENHAFLEEIERTVGLLIFGDDSKSPFRDLLDISHRTKVANEVNAAILSSQNYKKDPRLQSLLRMLIWSQIRLDETNIYPHINDLSTAKLEDPSV